MRSGGVVRDVQREHDPQGACQDGGDDLVIAAACHFKIPLIFRGLERGGDVDFDQAVVCVHALIIG